MPMIYPKIAKRRPFKRHGRTIKKANHGKRPCAGKHRGRWCTRP